MSHKIIEVKETRNSHIFNCDKCDKKIMESIECNDGYYEEPDFIEESVFVHGVNKRYIYKTGFFCEDCLRKSTNELIDKLLSIGFKEWKEHE